MPRPRPVVALLLLAALHPQDLHAAPDAGPRFRPRDAVRAEWARAPPTIPAAERAALPPADQERLLRSEKRIGRPGAQPLLPPELDHPELAIWEGRAAAARTPEERFTALALLNRLKSSKALSALAGLGRADSASWPRHLHLDGQVAAARLRGEVETAELRAFLAALPADRGRAQAARLRLVLDGKEAALLAPVPATAGAILAALEAWNRAPFSARAAPHLALLERVALGLDDPVGLSEALGADGSPWSRLGLLPPTRAQIERSLRGLAVRLLEGLPDPAPARAKGAVLAALGSPDLAIHRAALEALGKLREPAAAGAAAAVGPTAASAPLSPEVAAAARAQASTLDARLQIMLLPSLRRLSLAEADGLGRRMLHGDDPAARAAAIEDLLAPPDDLEGLAAVVQRDDEVDALQALVAALSRWKLPPERRRALLLPFLTHRTWIHRYEAWRALAEMPPPPEAPPWPPAPAVSPPMAAILAEAERLAEAGRPVRLRITFSGHRAIVLALDPTLAPINVANLTLLARRHFFDGMAVPRVVPDFVVQMGSPVGTMDGGPGYSVRCELSPAWFGPGSVGMALSGKDTGGSQFFITTNATPHLTGHYTRLGAVEDPGRALPLLDDLELGARIEKIEVL